MYRKEQYKSLIELFKNFMIHSEEMLDVFINYLEKHHVDDIEKIKKMENQANKYELKIEDEAISFLALNQAEASILRTIIMIIKMNNDLERICDHITSSCFCIYDLEQANFINDTLKVHLYLMATKTQLMLKDINFAFFNKDIEIAKNIIKADNEIDKLHKETNKLVIVEIIKNPTKSSELLLYQKISKNLERICDLITNIAEDVIFITTGEDIRHTNLET